MLIGIASSWRARLTIAAGAGLLVAGCAAEAGQPDIPQQPGFQPQAGDMAPTVPNVPTPQPGDNGTPTSTPPAGPTQPTMPTIPAGQQPMPCAVAQTVANHCGECHGQQTNWGAPMKLVTYDDFQAEAPISKGRKVFEVAAERIVKEALPMPPKGLVAPDLIKPLSDWLAAGAPAGTAADATCVVNTPTTEMPSPTETPTTLPADATCYELTNHGGQTINETPFMVPAGETYVEFAFEVPWKEEIAAVRWRTVYDQTAVLHHWLTFAGSTGTVTAQPGTSRTSIGSHTGAGVELIAGWAVGGNDVEIPEGIAMQMPAPGTRLLIEWHFFNQSGSPVADRSGVEICTVPKASVDPKRLGSMTWLGTENFNGLFGMPAGQESKFSGTCTPSRTGLDANESIKIFGFLPHMHLIGTHMTTVVNRANGMKETVFDKPFQFDRQLYYVQDPVIEIFPGDTLTSTCTFFNNTSSSVVYGPSTTNEMCYQFAFSYPARALENGVIGLSGATNTCW